MKPSWHSATTSYLHELVLKLGLIRPWLVPKRCSQPLGWGLRLSTFKCPICFPRNNNPFTLFEPKWPTKEQLHDRQSIPFTYYYKTERRATHERSVICGWIFWRPILGTEHSGVWNDLNAAILFLLDMLFLPSRRTRPAPLPVPHLAVLQKQPRASAPSASLKGVSCRPGCRRASPLRCYGSPCTWHTAFEDRAQTEEFTAYSGLLNTWENYKILVFKPIQHLYWTIRLDSLRKDEERQRSWHMQLSNLVASRPSPNATDIVIHEQHSNKSTEG